VNQTAKIGSKFGVQIDNAVPSLHEVGRKKKDE
jgi:hypothetical protein